MFSKNRFFWFAALAGLVFDRLSKFWVVYTFPLTDPPQTLPLIPNVLHFTYVVNTGAAFSFFAQGVGWLRWLTEPVTMQSVFGKSTLGGYICEINRIPSSSG